MKAVSLIIPAYNEADVIGPCLDSAMQLYDRGELAEILVVDDGSSDGTADVVGRYPRVRLLRGEHGGPGAARNLGIREAEHPLVWFVDADCVIEPDALRFLRPHLDDPEVGGVSGSYGNMREGAFLPSLIHEEIVERHLRMPVEVNFAATFNVLYQRDLLMMVNGFDERFLKGEDAELSFRVRRAGFKLHFEVRSRVRHFHEGSLRRYLDVQRGHGYYRVLMYREHPDKLAGDSYSGVLDHVQPPLAVLSACLPLLGPAALATLPVSAALWYAPLPMAMRLLRRTRDPRQLAHVPMSVLRAYARGLGLLEGVLRVASDRYLSA